MTPDMNTISKRGANPRMAALRAAFPYTIPIMAGFLFLGMTYGVYMVQSGFDFWYPMLTSIAVFGGSLEFMIVTLLLSPFNPLQALMVALMIQARHLFYGITMLDRYRDVGKKKPYMIFGLCDETFSIVCSVDAPGGVSRSWFMFFVTLLDQAYWFCGCTLGALFGMLIRFNTQGLDFAMTALFVVIFIEQWRKDRQHISAMIGLGFSVLSLLIFGPDNFLLPSMGAILAALAILQKPIERKGGEAA